MTAYEVLGVPEQASEEAIQRAWRKQCWRAHPDRGGSLDLMKEVNRARDVLLTDRAAYDAYLKRHRQPAPIFSYSVLTEASNENGWTTVWTAPGNAAWT